MDERILALAKQKASQEGKSLDEIVEQSLRVALQKVPNGIADIPYEGEPLEENDPFFLALKKARSKGRIFSRRGAFRPEE